MSDKNLYTKLPFGYIPNNTDGYYILNGTKYIQKGSCTGETKDDYSQEGGPNNIEVWIFQFGANIAKTVFNKMLEEGKVYKLKV
jgi:hypothetical protein